MDKRKYLVFFSFLILLLFLTACEEVHLPGEPTPPGRQGAFVGQAIAGFRAYPDWAAQPDRMFVYPEELEYDSELNVKIIDYDYIYRFGYYFNTEDNLWEMFELEDGMKAEDWYLDKVARAEIEVDRDVFQIGENYIVLYGCDKAGEYFDCNENKWMLTYFIVVPEEDYDNWIIEDDIDDFLFLSSRREKRTLAGARIKVYIAEYMKDNDKATVEVATAASIAQAKRLLKPWNMFTQNYQDYNGSWMSIYEMDDEYYVMWISNSTTVNIHFEKDEFPTELVEEYLDKWPSTKIDLTDPQLAGEEEEEEEEVPEGCGV